MSIKKRQETRTLQILDRVSIDALLAAFRYRQEGAHMSFRTLDLEDESEVQKIIVLTIDGVEEGGVNGLGSWKFRAHTGVEHGMKSYKGCVYPETVSMTRYGYIDEDDR